jgi:hypothetical protein
MQLQCFGGCFCLQEQGIAKDIKYVDQDILTEAKAKARQ